MASYSEDIYRQQQLGIVRNFISNISVIDRVPHDLDRLLDRLQPYRPGERPLEVRPIIDNMYVADAEQVANVDHTRGYLYFGRVVSGCTIIRVRGNEADHIYHLTAGFGDLWNPSSDRHRHSSLTENVLRHHLEHTTNFNPISIEFVFNTFHTGSVMRRLDNADQIASQLGVRDIAHFYGVNGIETPDIRANVAIVMTPGLIKPLAYDSSTYYLEKLV